MEVQGHNVAFDEITRRRRMRRKLDLLLRAYSSMGLLITILAGAYFIITFIPAPLTREQRMALMLAGVGTALALMSRTAIILRRERDFQELDRLKEYESLSSFLDTWTRFERTSKDVLAKQGDDFNRHSLRSVISRLYEEGKIDRGDVVALDEALQTRNAIVHGEKPLSMKLASQLTDTLLEIIRKIALP